MSAPMTALTTYVPLAAAPKFFLLGIAAAISLAAFGGLILVPVLGAFKTGREKLAAGVLSLFVLAALVIIGLVIGFVIFYNWDSISRAL
jgi:hypothetical protein